MVRQIGFIAAAVMIIIMLAACGSATDTPAALNTPPAESAVTTGSAPGTSADVEKSNVRTITHLKGTTDIPAQIDRIIVLSAAYTDHLLTIGEKPAAINVETRYNGDYLPYLASQLQGVQTVGSADSPNLEAIVLLNPDVILIESRTAESTYDELNKIAPTIVLGNEWLDYEDNEGFWKKDLLTIAEMYDKTDVAQAKIAELDKKTAQAKEKLASLGNKKLAFMRVREKAMQIYAEKGHPLGTLLYESLGFEPTALTPELQRVDLSMEVLPELDADYLVLEVDPNGYNNLDSMNKSVLWNNVPAVQNEHVFESDSFWLFKSWGALGRSEIIDDILEMIGK
ncbi:ABC transporter substrate-binding protein [Paenibacillus sp. SYP-B4298]|uniref:ABC transporter substrate-binding protein n=1 Tax=Paenibacillus sp. SYP-B4298 TaxID=2996034 RepID=UPI0022DDD0B9|nr:iron-siderophore ABC transporter substrate-binding protein [Paenibacillus sp. SYP-B4298]